MPVREIHYLYQVGHEEYVVLDQKWYVRLIYWFLRRRGLLKQKPKVEARLSKHKNIEEEIMRQIEMLHANYEIPAIIVLGHKEEIELVKVINDLPALYYDHRNPDGSVLRDIMKFQGLEVRVVNWFDGIMVLPTWAEKPKIYKVPGMKNYYRKLYER